MERLLQGDCLDRFKEIEDNSVDMVLVDPPYGTTNCSWDVIIPFEPMWEEIKRVIKNNSAVIFTSSQPFTSMLVNSNLKWFKCEWIWKKNRGSNFGNTRFHPMKEHENVLVFSKKRHNYYPIKEERSESGKNRVNYEFKPSNTGKRKSYHLQILDDNKTNEKQDELRYPSSVQKFNCEVGYHSNQKPVTLIEYLIRTYTKENETVFDFAMGSGTTGVACKRLNRNFIGIEKDPEIFEIAEKRINKVLNRKEISTFF